jgi:predicted transcriptional regulator
MKTTELQLFVALRVKEIRWRRIYRGASIMETWIGARCVKSTVKMLCKRGWLRVKHKDGRYVFELTELGRAALWNSCQEVLN